MRRRGSTPWPVRRTRRLRRRRLLPVSGGGPSAAICAVSALAAAAVYLALGLLRISWVSTFLSKAVITGFVLGFSMGIVIDQSHKLLGVPAPSGSYLQELWGPLKELPDTSGTTLSVGAGSLAVLLLMRYLLSKWPRAPSVMALSIPAVNRFDLADHGVAVTREVLTGLFSIGLPDIDWSDCGTLLTGALALAFVGYFESLAAARSMAVKHGYDIDPNQELIAQGMSCGTAGLVGGFSVDGSLSKTSVADSAGQEGVRPHPVGRPIRGRSWTPREPDGAQSPLEHDVARAHGCSSLRCDSDSPEPAHRVAELMDENEGCTSV